MKFLCFGTGAIGTYIGGSLALGGHQVVFLDRPDIAAVLRRQGLHLNLKGEEKVVANPLVAETLREALALGPFDAGLFAIKSYDTAAALESLVPYRSSVPPLLCLQNGVENESAIVAALGKGRVIAGTVTSSIGRRGTGSIVLERLRGVGLAAGHVLSDKLLFAFTQADLNARLYRRADDMKWSKMLTNLLSNATSAILEMTPLEVFGHPGLFALEMAQLREALQVMAARKVRVVDLPGTPVRALAFAAQRLPPNLARPILQRSVGGGRGKKMPSFHIDLHSGRGQSEVDWLNGAVVRFGAQVGVPTPVNRLLNDTLLRLTAGKIHCSATPANRISCSKSWQPAPKLPFQSRDKIR